MDKLPETPDPDSESPTMPLHWRFRTPGLDKAFYLSKGEDVPGREWAASGDQVVALPWTLLWAGIVARHAAALPARAILRSFAHLLVIISPCYMVRLLGRECYLRHRTLIVSLAILGYVLHPGGGLYRDAVMVNEAERTGLNALDLFVRLVVGSRTLFWMILVLGYRLPPAVGIPLNMAGLAAMSRLRPVQPFCAAMQTKATRGLFALIAANLPMVSVLPLPRPQLAPDADICNPLVRWLQLALGLLLPTALQLAADFRARRAFASAHASQLGREDRDVWLNPAAAAFSPGSLAALLYFNASVALWFALIYSETAPLA